MRRDRHAARVLLIDGEDRILLFRFTPENARAFWATVGGEVDAGESYAQAARRELFEETGITADPGSEVAERTVDFVTLDGEPVRGIERYFVVRVDGASVDDAGHTALERRVMTAHRWWQRHELAESGETIYPEDLADLLHDVLAAKERA